MVIQKKMLSRIIAKELLLGGSFRLHSTPIFNLAFFHRIALNKKDDEVICGRINNLQYLIRNAQLKQNEINSSHSMSIAMYPDLLIFVWTLRKNEISESPKL